MTITYVGTGSVVNGLNVATTPTAPAYQAGDALFYATWEFMGSDAAPATPSGWSLLSPNSSFNSPTVWGRIAQSSSDTIPSFNWGATNRGFGVISVFRGVDASFTSVVAGTAERGSNVTQNIVGPASTKLPTQNNSLVLCFGARNKTSTSDGSVYTAPTGWTGMLYSNVPNGTSVGGAAAYWIQTTATATAANFSINGSIADGSTQAMHSTSLFIAPAASGGGGGGGTGTVTFPPPKRKTYVFYDLYYPR